MSEHKNPPFKESQLQMLGIDLVVYIDPEGAHAAVGDPECKTRVANCVQCLATILCRQEAGEEIPQEGQEW